MGLTTVMFTTLDVEEMPPAVATAVMAYPPAARLDDVTLNGALVAEPVRLPLVKNCTLVTVPPEIEALAASRTLAGAANTLPFAGFVIVTLGAGFPGVERA